MRIDNHTMFDDEPLPADPTLREIYLHLEALNEKFDAMLAHGEKRRMKAVARETINEVRAERKSFWR